MDRFRKAGIRAYEGPKTCLRCHEYAQIEDAKTGEVKNVEARWIPMDPSMEIGHAIRREGSLTCADCHSPDGVLDRQELGYTDAAIEMYQQNPLE